MSIEEAAARLQAAFDKAVEARGRPSTHSHGEIVDDEWNRDHFAFASALSDATGLDFVQLAGVELENGNYGVSKVIDALPEDTPEGEEARRLRTVHRLGSGLYEDEAREYLSTLDGPEACLDAMVQAWSLRTTSMPPAGFGPSAYPSAAKAAEATGLSFQKLAAIEHKGGKIGLRRALERIPGVDDGSID